MFLITLLFISIRIYIVERIDITAIIWVITIRNNRIIITTTDYNYLSVPTLFNCYLFNI